MALKWFKNNLKIIQNILTNYASKCYYVYIPNNTYDVYSMYIRCIDFQYILIVLLENLARLTF